MKFIRREVSTNRDYTSTTFRLLLNVIKLTVEGGYWRKYEDLLEVISKLDGLHEEPETINRDHSNYEEKVNDRNLMRSKSTALSISIQLIDLQISLWISDMVENYYDSREFDQRVDEFISKEKHWRIGKKIFQLCSTRHSELMKKALVLFYKIYNLHKLFYKGYEEAKIEIASKMELL